MFKQTPHPSNNKIERRVIENEKTYCNGDPLSRRVGLVLGLPLHHGLRPHGVRGRVLVRGEEPPLLVVRRGVGAAAAVSSAAFAGVADRERHGRNK